MLYKGSIFAIPHPCILPLTFSCVHVHLDVDNFFSFLLPPFAIAIARQVHRNLLQVSLFIAIANHLRLPFSASNLQCYRRPILIGSLVHFAPLHVYPYTSPHTVLNVRSNVSLDSRVIRPPIRESELKIIPKIITFWKLIRKPE